MRNCDNIDNEKRYHKKIISICDNYPRDEEMLILKAESLKYLKKSYKLLECLESILKINPNNNYALYEIAIIKSEEQC